MRKLTLKSVLSGVVAVCALMLMTGCEDSYYAKHKCVYSNMKVYEEPSRDSKVIYTIPENCNYIVKINSEADNGWAAIEWEEAAIDSAIVGYVEVENLHNLPRTAKYYSFSSERWELILIAVLILLSIFTIVESVNIGFILLAIIYVLEILYLNLNQGCPEWFVRPWSVGWIWTFVNGALFLIFIFIQYYAAMVALAHLGVAGIIGDWGMKIAIAGCVLTPGCGPLVALCVVPILFFRNVIASFNVRTIFYTLLGCIVWVLVFYLFYRIIQAFHLFFIWTIVLFFFSKIPIDSSISTGKQVEIHYDGDQRYYTDSGGVKHPLDYAGSGGWRDERGRMFDGSGKCID